MAYAGGFLPAFSNLPIYNAAAIIPVEPDPPPADPEPTPDFATEFTGVTLGAPIITVPNHEAVYNISGTDSETSFVCPPTGSPLYALSSYGGYGTGYGVHLKSSPAYPFASPYNSAEIQARGLAEIVDTVVRGETTKALRMTLKAPGAAVDQTRQMWYMFYRNVGGAYADLVEYTCRFEIKFPSFAGMFTYNPSYRGRFAFFDMKTGTPSGVGGDFRYVLSVVQNASEGGYRFECYADSTANGDAAGYNVGEFWRFEDTADTHEVPQVENFSGEVSWIRPATYANVTDGRFRFRIRRESDSVTTWRTVFDVNQSSIAAWNAAHGTSLVNRHRGIAPIDTNPGKVQRIFNGIYPRIKNVDFVLEMAKFRAFNSFNI